MGRLKEKKKNYFCFTCQYLDFIAEALFHLFGEVVTPNRSLVTWLLLTRASGKHKTWTVFKSIQRNGVKRLAKKTRGSMRTHLWGLVGLLLLTTIFKVIFPWQEYENKPQRGSEPGDLVPIVDSSLILVTSGSKHTLRIFFSPGSGTNVYEEEFLTVGCLIF